MSKMNEILREIINVLKMLLAKPHAGFRVHTLHERAFSKLVFYLSRLVTKGPCIWIAFGFGLKVRGSNPGLGPQVKT